MAEDVYNYSSFSALSDSKPFRDDAKLRAGAEAPELAGETVEGEKVRLSDFRGKTHVALEFGSISSPQFCAGLPTLEKLRSDFEPKGFKFFVIYTRECHPGENYPHHTSYEQKRRHAADCRQKENITLPIIVDDLEGKIHRAYGSLPNMCYVVDKWGRIFYRSQWAVHEEMIDVLAEMIRIDEEVQARGASLPPGRFFYSERLKVHYTDPEARRRVFERLGPKSQQDWDTAMGRRAQRAQSGKP